MLLLGNWPLGFVSIFEFFPQNFCSDRIRSILSFRFSATLLKFCLWFIFFELFHRRCLPITFPSLPPHASFETFQIYLDFKSRIWMEVQVFPLLI